MISLNFRQKEMVFKRKLFTTMTKMEKQLSLSLKFLKNRMASKRRAKPNTMKFHSEEWKDNKMKAENVK